MEEQQEDPDSELESLKTFIIFWLGQLFSMLGSSIVFFSIIWWITEETQSAVFLSISATISFLPNLIVIPIAGVFSDIWDRKKTILFSDLFQALTTISVISMFVFGFRNVWIIIALNSLRFMFQSFHQPAASAVIPLMIPKEKLSQVNGITNMTNSIIHIIGPVIGAILLTFLEIEQVLWVDIITFILAGLILLCISIPKVRDEKKESKERTPYWSEFKLGFETMKETPGLLTLALLCAFVNFTSIPVNILISFYVHVTHIGVEGDLALVMVLLNAGMIIGSLIATFKKKWKNKQKVVLITGVLFLSGNLILAIAPTGSFLMIGLGKFVYGLNISLNLALYYTIFQISVPPDQQGRIYSIDMVISFVLSPIGMIISGPLADLLGIRLFFIIFTVFGISANLIVYFFSNILNIDYDKIHEEIKQKL